jgi:spermidine synthase
LELRQRGADFLIQIRGRVLMNSAARRSEEELAALGLQHLDRAPTPRVLISGLGMGCTLRAALDLLPPRAAVDVVEINPVVSAWCRGPLAALNRDALLDPRVTVHTADVARVIKGADPGSYSALVLDLYEGPHAATQAVDDPFYGMGALARCRAALMPGGVLTVWSEAADAAFEARLRASGLQGTAHRLAAGGGAATHVVYRATRSR